jgi:serine protease Do
MRFHILSILVVGLVTGTRLPAQANWPQTFSFSDSGLGGSRLGVQLRDIDPDRANIIKLGEPRGVEVVGVEDDSPAEKAGLKSGDVLLSYNGESIMGAQQLGRLVAETPRGRKVKIDYWRDGKTSSVTATTAAAAVSRALPFPGVPDSDLREFTRVARSVPMPMMVWKTNFLGVECEPLETQLADYFGVKHGVLVRSVAKDSAAGKSGVKAGDVITQIGDRTVNDPRDIASYMRSERRSTKPMMIEITRDHKPMSFSVKMSEENQE